MGNNVLHSHDTPEWYTPSHIVEAAREVMGEIYLDPASHEEANRTVQATLYYDEKRNGLARTWSGSVFLNPPGGLVNEFWEKLVDSYERGDVEEAIWVGYSLEQLQTLQHSKAILHPLDYPICITNSRIAFVENEAKHEERVKKLLALGKKPSAKSSPSHGNYIVYMGSHKGHFARVFGKFGKVKL